MPSEPSHPGEQAGSSITALLHQLRSWSKEGKKPTGTGRDGFPLYAEDPLADFHLQLDAFLKEIPSLGAYWKVNPDTLPTGSALLKLGSPQKVEVLRAILVRARFSAGNQPRPSSTVDRTRVILGAWAESAWRVFRGEKNSLVETDEFRPLVSGLLRSNLPLTADDVTQLVSLVADVGNGAEWGAVSAETALRAVERFAETSDLTGELRKELECWKESFGVEDKVNSTNRKLLTRIKAVLGQETEPGIAAGEAWSNTALEDLKQMSVELFLHWSRLLQHCQQAETSRPTQKWSKTANQLIEGLGREEFKKRVLQWFELVALPRPVHQEPRDTRYSPDPDQLIADGNSVILKGLAWSCAEWKDGDISRALSRLAQVCFKKVRNLGARCPRIGNACLYSLSVTSSEDAAAELTRLNQIIKQPSTKKLLGKSLDKAAALSGQTREDLEESTVPHYGLDADGHMKQTFGDFTAEFSIRGPEAMELQWRKADGNLQKSVPAEVKEKHAVELKALKRNIQDIEKMLPAQRQRIERFFLSEREWEFEKWRERYLDHPLLAHLTRRLIWHFHQKDQQAAGIWHQGQIVDVQERPLDWLLPTTSVRLWHPLGEEMAVVGSWRRWFESHRIAQPFKQAHREIYILTDAERQTERHSNRFAAHIIRQHQFAALAKERGWICQRAVKTSHRWANQNQPL